MDEKQLQALATELTKNLKAPEDLSQLSRFLKKLTVETALKAELAAHLGHEKHQPKSGSNTCNGYSSETLLTEEGALALQTPRDRESTFESHIIKKNLNANYRYGQPDISLVCQGHDHPRYRRCVQRNV